MTKNFVRSLAIAALACAGASATHAQTILQLSYPSTAPGTTPCLYTTNGAGISADPLTGNLIATGDFSTGCPQTGPTLPLPVIVPGPANWVLPNPLALNQAVPVQWAAVNATSCTYGGASAGGWPSGQPACPTSANPSCQDLHDVQLIPNIPGGNQVFSLTCLNATGSATSSSSPRAVTANPPSILSGPANWAVLPWQAGQSRALSWAADADSCVFEVNQLPSVAGVPLTLTQFFSNVPSSCSTASACSTPHPVTLTAPVEGSYDISLRCTRAGNPVSAVSRPNQPWNVTPNSAGTCLQPAPGWNRLQTAEMFADTGYYYSSRGFHDATQYASIFGRDYSPASAPNYPIIAQWPGVGQQLVGAKIGNNEFVAAKFRTPATGQQGHSLNVDYSAFVASGGGTGGSSLARISVTVSKLCGDFDSNSTNIAPNCKWSQRGGIDQMGIYNNYPGSASCNLTPNTDYYLNIIHAPLTSPASAVFNGSMPNVPLVQNSGVYSQ